MAPVAPQGGRGFHGGNRGGGFQPRGRGGGFRGGNRGGGGGRGGFDGGRGRGGFDGGRGRGGFDGGRGRGGFDGGRGRGGFGGGRGRGGFEGGRGRGGFEGGRGRGNFQGGRGGGGGRGGFGGNKGNRTEESRPGSIARINEVRDGLQLRIMFAKEAPSEDSFKQSYPGFHSWHTRQYDRDNKRIVEYLALFTDIESLEKCKKALSKDENVSTVDYMGIKADKYQNPTSEVKQLHAIFSENVDEEYVKGIHEKIVSIESKGAGWFLEFEDTENAKMALKQLLSQRDVLKITYVKASFAMQDSIDLQNGFRKDMVVLRDVSKEATLQDFAELFPGAIAFHLYKNTFPDSPYCHAYVKFSTNKEAEAALELKKTKIKGKKIFVYQAHSTMLQDTPNLGKVEKQEAKLNARKAEKVDEEAPVAKKQKKESAENNENEEEAEVDEEDEEENGDDEEDEEGEEDEEEDDEDEDDEEDDDDDDDDED